MQILTNFHVQIKEPCILVLGNFDGFHLGHQKLIREAQKIKKENNGKILLMTFESNMNRKKDYLMSPHQKENYIRNQQIDYYMTLPLDESIRLMKAYEFIAHVTKYFHVVHFVLSQNHHFGFKKEGDAAFLKRFSEFFNYQISIIPPLQHEGSEISSTKIRTLIAKGCVSEAAYLLGRDFEIEGHVVKGKSVGQKMGFPTINLAFETDYVMPKFGVYASHMTLFHRKYKSITNVGSNPTFGQSGIHVETYILEGFHEIVCVDTPIEVSFFKFIRAEKKFDHKNELIKQIEKDVDFVKMLYKNGGL